MATTIGEFILRLAGDRDLLSSFSSDPEGTMRAAELDERHIAFLLSADLGSLRAKVVTEFRVDGVKVAIETVCIMKIAQPDES